MITTNLVLIELVSLLTRPIRLPKLTQIQIIQDLHRTHWLTIQRIEPTIELSAWKLWESRVDKSWSIIDCSSFVVMQQLNLTEALTADHHFKQAGFVPLLK